MTLVREACEADRAALAAILHRQLAGHSLCPPLAVIDATVGGILGRPEMARLLVAVARDARGTQNAIVGVAALTFVLSLEHGGLSTWLEELYVDPSVRGRGIGTSLLCAAQAFAAAHGARAIDLEVETGHERVNTLYERVGFRRHARQRWFLPLSEAPREERS
jgi:ribosomal protein S18 acetylase RimI-like enzyme